MIIMALDHTRDFFHEQAMVADPTNLETTTPALFFTRWITHYCAPVFIFLSGVSAYLGGQKKTKAQLSRFLFTRGLWLVIAEATIISLGWTFNPFFNFTGLQVIWAIGCSMLLLSVLVLLPYRIIALVGVLLFFGHNIIDHFTNPAKGTLGDMLFKVLLTGSGDLYAYANNHFIAIFYAILPWTGTMVMGYVFGRLFTPAFTGQQRNKLCLFTGLALIALFVVLRSGNFYGDNNPWQPQRNTLYSVLSFINTTKYPPSLLYLCMTLGPAIALLPLLNKLGGWLANTLQVYGSVPFFYYICHIYLIHIVCVLLFFTTGHTTAQIVGERTPFLFRPQNFGFALGTVYLLWLLIVAALYLPCHWYSRYKQTHKHWWLSYV
jgi:uncharacterized membrane protein